MSFSVNLSARAENHAGGVATTPTATIFHTGPDYLRVATFNLNNPKLAEKEPSKRVEALARYGRDLFSGVELASVQEVADPGYLALIAQEAGMGYYSPGPGIGIVSRYPLRDEETFTMPGGEIHAATALIHGLEHRFIAIKLRPDPLPWVDDQDRLAVASRAVELASTHPIALIAGDFNVCARSVATNTTACAGHDAPGTEVTLLGTRMVDAFANGVYGPHCSDKRIDFAFVRGAYVITDYDTRQNNHPSDHPFVSISLAASFGDIAAPPKSDVLGCP